MSRRSCPAWFISAPASNHGKTTLTAALALWHRRQGRHVRVFKCGPDFIDPTILERASGHPVYQLDLWLAGADACRQLVHEAAQEADLILIEGVMGLFDGTPCSADLAQLLGVPVLAVVDVAGMAQTLGALAYGLANYRPGLRVAGVLANGVASARHEEMLRQGLPAGIAWLGSLPRRQQFSLPERHLGLVPAAEVLDLDARLGAVADLLGATALADLPPPCEFDSVSNAPPALAATALQGMRIAVARDAAFSFAYPANLDVLRGMGAQLSFFSPLHDAVLPVTDSVYLPGGYPELHLHALQENHAMRQSLRDHVAAGKTLYAECGGLLYLLDELTDKHGQSGRMTGILPGRASMSPRLQGLGYQALTWHGDVLRCHTFHHSLTVTPLPPVAHGERLFNTSEGERVWQQDGVTATYLHAYFGSAPLAAAALFTGSSRP